mmetsp:Transcript_12937/g.21885  ORF Transcript_12937/g.21885 Transcript_12937/m.21885 type:complete len:219 (+) Transcript_12937:331-987(+)
MARLVDQFDIEKERPEQFETKSYGREQYFLNSAWKMKPFFEVDALDKDGKLQVDRHMAFNKVGHAMHDLHPAFESFSYSQVVKTLCREVFQYKSPALVQSMYIFKNPRIGGEVGPHKDSSYLITQPLSCNGFWVSLDEATKENGCMWGVPGSHALGPNEYFRVRKNEEEGLMETFKDMDESVGDYKAEGAVPLEVPAGSIVLLNGSFLHYSEPNTSEK